MQCCLPSRATRFTHSILLDLISLMKWREGCALRYSSLRHFLHPALGFKRFLKRHPPGIYTNRPRPPPSFHTKERVELVIYLWVFKGLVLHQVFFNKRYNSPDIPVRAGNAWNVWTPSFYSSVHINNGVNLYFTIRVVLIVQIFFCHQPLSHTLWIF
jgi:hypothetical protein